MSSIEDVGRAKRDKSERHDRRAEVTSELEGQQEWLVRARASDEGVRCEEDASEGGKS